MSSRTVNKSEVARASFLHIKLGEYVFAYDGIAVIVNPQNPLNELSLGNIEDLLGKCKKWKDAGASKGGTIHVLSRPSYSGTHAFFLQRVVKQNDANSPDSFSPDTEWVVRNEDAVARVVADPDAVGYVGLGWLSKTVKALALSNGGPAVHPSEDTVQDASYPVSRPLLMYTRGAPSPNAASFIRFIFSSAGQDVIKSVGFVPAEATVLVVVPREKPEVPAYELFRIGFQDKSTTLQVAEEPKLNHAVDGLKAPKTKVLVVGNADSAEGDAKTARKIADDRARVVSDYLRQRGVAEANIVVASDGSTHPVVASGTPGQEVNRRTDVYIVHD